MIDSRETRHVLPRKFRLAGIFLVGLGLFLVASVPVLAKNDWDPTIFIKFPRGFPEFVEYGEDRLGDVYVAPEAGHDGKFYFVQAMDPFYLSPEENAVLIDRPTYRAQRMLYPTVAGAAGFAGAWPTVWAMYILNALAIGVGCVVTGLVARELRISEFFGLAFVANLGMLEAGLVDTAEIFGFALLMLGVYFCLRRSWRWMTVALTLAVLSRETMLAGAFGIVAYLVLTKERIPRSLVWMLVVPAAWFAYLQVQIGYLPGYDNDAQLFDLPFLGFIKALGYWNSQPVQAAHMTTGIILMSLAVMFLLRVLWNRNLVNVVAASFSLIAIVMSGVVWRQGFDSSRALAPLMTLYILSIPLRGVDSKRPEQAHPAAVGETV